MKKLLSVLLVSVFTFLTASAQDLSVRSMETLTMDTYASVHKRVDNNGTACAVVRVSLPLAGVTFSGNVMGDVQRDGSDYLVYMPAGSKTLWVKHPNFYELEVVFGDYGTDRLQSLVTYRVTVNVPQMGMAIQQDNGMTYFILNVQPKNAQVSIDGNLQPIDANGDYSILLPRGSHSYTVTAGGYETKTETFMLGTERKRVDVSLVSNMASLTINAATAGTQIYVNEQNRGTTRWTGQVLPGNYVIEGRLDGYYPHKQTITIANRQQQTISIPALVARTGSLDVSYKPSDSEVWIDGKKVGVSPDVFKGIIMGSHKVSIRKDGYATKDVTVNITEGQTATLTGALEQNAASATTTTVQETAEDSRVQETAEDSRVYDVVEQMPSFPGGLNALMQWISKNMKYPEEAEKKGIQGRVLVSFIVDKTGAVRDAKIAKSVDPLLDKEALHVVSVMPKWIPGKQNGKPVNVKYVVPLSFRLNNDK